jgi:gliding motility-associated protein GldC
MGIMEDTLTTEKKDIIDWVNRLEDKRLLGKITLLMYENSRPNMTPFTQQRLRTKKKLRIGKRLDIRKKKQEKSQKLKLPNGSENENYCFIRNKILYMKKSTITIDVLMDENRLPEEINWSATESTIHDLQKAKAMILAFWNSEQKEALRIDLWTQKMMVDEMADFFYQTLMTMADSYGRATRYTDQVEAMKDFAKEFLQTFHRKQLEQNKAN